MGMDVYGKAPTSEVGEYFRNNVWWWRPLADYILKVHPDLASSCAEWHSNSADGLNAAESVTLADALDADLAAAGPRDPRKSKGRFHAHVRRGG